MTLTDKDSEIMPTTEPALLTPELRRRNWDVQPDVFRRDSSRFHRVHARRRGLSAVTMRAYVEAIAKNGSRGEVVPWGADGVEWQLTWPTENFTGESDTDIFGLMLTHLDSLVYSVSVGRKMDDGFPDTSAALAECHRQWRELDAGKSVEDVYGY